MTGIYNFLLIICILYIFCIFLHPCVNGKGKYTYKCKRLKYTQCTYKPAKNKKGIMSKKHLVLTKKIVHYKVPYFNFYKINV